jgi:hypothetical protein
MNIFNKNIIKALVRSLDFLPSLNDDQLKHVVSFLRVLSIGAGGIWIAPTLMKGGSLLDQPVIIGAIAVLALEIAALFVLSKVKDTKK